jgi:hypothetical protein
MADIKIPPGNFTLLGTNKAKMANQQQPKKNLLNMSLYVFHVFKFEICG